MTTPFSAVYLVLHTAFCVIVVVSNIISGKIVFFSFLGGVKLPAGLLTYPLTFLISDLVTETYGSNKAKQMVYSAFVLTGLSYVIIQFALWLPSQDLINQQAFYQILGLNGWIIFASLIAYLFSQMVDIHLYTWIKNNISINQLWLRNNGSTLISQIADTFIVNFIHLYWALGMEWTAVEQTMWISYLYKAFFSVACTPLFYGCVYLLRVYQTKTSLLTEPV